MYDLPCDDVRGSVDDFIAGLGGFESAKITKICLLVKLQQKKTEQLYYLIIVGEGQGYMVNNIFFRDFLATQTKRSLLYAN